MLHRHTSTKQSELEDFRTITQEIIQKKRTNYLRNEDTALYIKDDKSN